MLYQLYNGGRNQGVFCNGEFDKKPAHSQFDYRIDGKGSSITNTWSRMVKELESIYGLSPKDLVVGDELAFALIPNFTTYESIGVHMTSIPAGFTFDIISGNGIVLTSTKHESVIGTDLGVVSTTHTAGALPTVLGSPLGTSSKTTVFTFNNRIAYVDNCDELILKITAIPALVDGGAGALGSVVMALRVDFDNHFDSGRA